MLLKCNSSKGIVVLSYLKRYVVITPVLRGNGLTGAILIIPLSPSFPKPLVHFYDMSLIWEVANP